MKSHISNLPYLTMKRIGAELEIGNYDDAADLAGDFGWLYPGHENISDIIKNLGEVKEACVKQRRYKPAFTLSCTIRELENHGLTREGYINKEVFSHRSHFFIVDSYTCKDYRSTISRKLQSCILYIWYYSWLSIIKNHRKE